MGNAASLKQVKEFERVSDYKKDVLADKIAVEAAKAEKERQKENPGEKKSFFEKTLAKAKGTGTKEEQKAALKKKLSGLFGGGGGEEEAEEENVPEDPAPSAGSWEFGKPKYPQTETRFDLADFRKSTLVRFRGDADNKDWDTETAMLPPDPDDRDYRPFAKMGDMRKFVAKEPLRTLVDDPYSIKRYGAHRKRPAGVPVYTEAEMKAIREVLEGEGGAEGPGEGEEGAGAPAAGEGEEGGAVGAGEGEGGAAVAGEGEGGTPAAGEGGGQEPPSKTAAVQISQQPVQPTARGRSRLAPDVAGHAFFQSGGSSSSTAPPPPLRHDFDAAHPLLTRADRARNVSTEFVPNPAAALGGLQSAAGGGVAQAQALAGGGLSQVKNQATNAKDQAKAKIDELQRGLSAGREQAKAQLGKFLRPHKKHAPFSFTRLFV